MRSIVRAVVLVPCIAGLFFSAIGIAEAQADPVALGTVRPTSRVAGGEATFEVTKSYTAQRRPRVTVLAFDDTNAGAQRALYGSSVEAMLVTFLKRKSQFVVVERQKLGRLLDEKQRLQRGMVRIDPDDRDSRALLEKIDVFVLGSVTLLDVSTSVDARKKAEEKIADLTAGGEAPSDRQEKRQSITGSRVEIDVKLISRFDGRIIAAAQRSGPVACLRSIVERLGIALEQEYLRPYYGQLTVTLKQPENIRVWLTPILLDDALDEEKPPGERSSTVTIGTEYDVVEPWTTAPIAYTIKNVLSGWYSMHIERPGYSPIGIENARWEVRKRLGREVVYDRKTSRPLSEVEPSVRRFVVRVDPLTTEVVDGDALGFTFVKEGGSIAPLVKRQYVDSDYTRAPQRVILMGGEKIKLNQLEPAAEYADDERCDLFDEQKPESTNNGRTFVATGDSFDFDLFTGGELIIEDYHGEVVPVGEYELALWEPSYQTEKAKVVVHSGDDKTPVKTSLTRETAALEIEATGPRPANRVVLEGRETHRRSGQDLDFDKPRTMPALPVDVYLTTTNIADLEHWQREVVIPPTHVAPPYFDTEGQTDALKLIPSPKLEPEPKPHVRVKTRFGLAGRLDILSRRPDRVTDDLFIDEECATILNRLLYGAPQRSETLRAAFWKAATEKVRRRVRKRRGASADQALPPLPEVADALPATTEDTDRPLLPGMSPEEQARLGERLAERLEVLDLVVLDPLDMAQLARSPEVAAILARFVDGGGSIFAYVSAVGDYRYVIGSPFSVESLSKRTRRLDLSPGQVGGLIPPPGRTQVKVKLRRKLPIVKKDLSPPWRVLAFTREGRKPRIVERPGREDGGSVVLWLDDPLAFRSRKGGTRSKAEEARARVEDFVLRQARDHMRRRFGPAVEALQPCTVPPVPLPAADKL